MAQQRVLIGILLETLSTTVLDLLALLAELVDTVAHVALGVGTAVSLAGHGAGAGFLSSETYGRSRRGGGGWIGPAL